MILLVFLAIALYACYGMLKPYLEPIILAILIGLLAQPVHQRLVKLLRGRQSTAAVISCLLLMLVILIPTLVLLGAILKQGINYSVIVREWATQDNIQQFLSHPWLVESRDRLTSVLPDGALDPDNIRSKALAVATVMGKQFAGVSTSILGSMTRLVFNFMLLLFVLFFVLRDQSKLVAFIHRALPLARTQEETLFKEVRGSKQISVTRHFPHGNHPRGGGWSRLVDCGIPGCVLGGSHGIDVTHTTGRYSTGMVACRHFPHVYWRVEYGNFYAGLGHCRRRFD